MQSGGLQTVCDRCLGRRHAGAKEMATQRETSRADP